MIPSRIGSIGGGYLSLVISTDQTNFNLRTALGSPVGVKTITVTINSGVILSSNDPTVPAFNTGDGWTSGSKLILVNNGRIAGKGGSGGRGYTITDTFGVSFCPEFLANSVTGQAGGAGLRLSIPTTVTNASGEIFGGGGGGGGGGAGYWGAYCDELYEASIPGCGGGGGQGSSTASGGTYGDYTYGGAVEASQGRGGFPSNNGSSGNSSAAGVGGVRVQTPANAGNDNVQIGAGAGGTGGGWGVAGSAGTVADINGVPVTQGDGAPFYASSVGSGGAAGKAVDLNGQTVTWISGNDGTHVKGAVA